MYRIGKRLKVRVAPTCWTAWPGRDHKAFFMRSGCGHAVVRNCSPVRSIKNRRNKVEARISFRSRSIAEGEDECFSISNVSAMIEILSPSPSSRLHLVCLSFPFHFHFFAIKMGVCKISLGTIPIKRRQVSVPGHPGWIGVDSWLKAMASSLGLLHMFSSCVRNAPYLKISICIANANALLCSAPYPYRFSFLLAHVLPAICRCNVQSK